LSLQGLKMTLAPGVWRLLTATVRLAEFDPPPELEPGPFIFACLHRDILPAIMHVKPQRPVLLVSNSPDGDILIRTLGEQDYRFVRGATGLDGRRALVDLRRCLQEGQSVGIAVDGPEGPYGSIREGVLHLARLTGVPVLPLVADAPGALVLDTWDRTVVPAPFRRVQMSLGPVLRIHADAGQAELEIGRETLAEFFGVTEETV
jgi:lysophospholipid acyltransferase (LPLAT)-like uncharacterized protein